MKMESIQRSYIEFYMETPNHFFYILLCKDGSFYGGYTNNIQKRIERHNEGKGAKYTRAKRPVKLLYNETYCTKNDAMSAEYSFKQLSRKGKEQFLAERGVNYVAAKELS
jgi:putative endonuclease